MRAHGLANEIMADVMREVKSGKKTPAEAAATAVEFANEATDEALKFLLLKGAFGLYLQGGRCDEALSAFDRLMAEVKDVPDKVLVDIIRARPKRIPNGDVPASDVHCQTPSVANTIIANDWTIPTDLKEPKRIDFDFDGGAEALSFFAITGGTGECVYYKKAHFKVARPFWIAQMPISCRQFQLFPKAELSARGKAILDAHATDRDLLVLAVAKSPDVLDGYLKWLNQTYGKRLPEGWVFRLPTLAEISVVQNGYLPYLDPTISLRDWQQKRTEDFHKVRNLNFDDKFVLVDAAIARRSTRVFVTRGALSLDCFEFPGVRNPNGHDVMTEVWARLLGKDLEPNQFWYCDRDILSRRYCDIKGLWSKWEGFLDHYGVAIHLVVGFDYVGEWNAKRGK